MSRRNPIYVESLIDAPIESVREATQDPAMHRRWDVPFGEIEYLPRNDGEPQRFRYATTVVPGLTVAGTGYWRYLPTADGVRLLTRYDYRPRWGKLGEQIDRVLLRPLFGRATAWSFDRLRIWLEDGTPPEVSRNLAIAHASAAGGVAATWIYHGLIPKLLVAHRTEQVFWESLGVSGGAAKTLVRLTGIPEIAMGLATARWSGQRWPFVITLVVMPVLAAGAIASEKGLWARAFNPVSLNTGLMALSTVALATRRGRPEGRKALREAPDLQPDVDELP